jgi:hypothetical protein
MSGEDHYPYARYDECSWHPEEVARRLGALSSRARRLHDRRAVAVAGVVDDHLLHVEDDDGRSSSRLLTNGRSTIEVRSLRRAYGSNSLHGDLVVENDDDEKSEYDIYDDRRHPSSYAGSSSSSGGGNNRRNRSSLLLNNASLLRYCRLIPSVILPIIRAFYDQLKEPLILMLLFSAMISLCLGNAADALSIGMALCIVSLVAAIQEYRSERGEFFFLCFGDEVGEGGGVVVVVVFTLVLVLVLVRSSSFVRSD